MKPFRIPFAATCVFALLALTMSLTAQTVLSNESLVSTTLVVNKTASVAQCKGAGCAATAAMFAPIVVTCPVPTGLTCTLYISLDARTQNTEYQALGPTGIAFYQFLIDGNAPSVGPTDNRGDYGFAVGVAELSPPFGPRTRQSYPAAVVGTVTNQTSEKHTVAVSIGCKDNFNFGQCQVSAFASIMRVDVFKP